MLSTELKKNVVYIPEGVKKIYEAIIKDGRSLVINQMDLDSELVPNGALFIDAGTSKMKIKKHGYVSSIKQEDVFEPQTVTDYALMKDSINGDRLRQRSVTRERIEVETLTGKEIQNNTLTGAKIAFDQIEHRHIKANAIDTFQIKNNAVNGQKIAVKSINENHIIDDAIKSHHIKEGNILNNHLETNIITTDKIETNAIISRHIENNVIRTEHIADGQILGRHIATGTITNDKYASFSISTDKIQNSAITLEKIRNGAVNTDKIMNDSVTYTKLANVVEQRIKSSLDVINGTGTLTTLNALENVITKTLNASGVATVGSLTVRGNATIFGVTHSKGDITTDGKIYRVAYNDIAEAYVPGEALEPGDIVQIQDDGKVYKSNFESSMVVGVYSDCFGDCFGATMEELESGAKVPIGMIGQVPVKVIGPVKLGQYIIAGDDGIGYPVADDCSFPVRTIGKAIQSLEKKGVHRVLCLIYPS